VASWVRGASARKQRGFVLLVVCVRVCAADAHFAYVCICLNIIHTHKTKTAVYHPTPNSNAAEVRSHIHMHIVGKATHPSSQQKALCGWVFARTLECSAVLRVSINYIDNPQAHNSLISAWLWLSGLRAAPCRMPRPCRNKSALEPLRGRFGPAHFLRPGCGYRPHTGFLRASLSVGSCRPVL
jgi:hypothetical protein